MILILVLVLILVLIGSFHMLDILQVHLPYGIPISHQSFLSLHFIHLSISVLYIKKLNDNLQQLLLSFHQLKNRCSIYRKSEELIKCNVYAKTPIRGVCTRYLKKDWIRTLMKKSKKWLPRAISFLKRPSHPKTH